ncbi:unnamed protein product, partial [Tetraodon nigroviridis]
THTLKYFYYRSSGVPNFPEFLAVVMVDDVQISHCDSNTRRAEPRQEWMEKVTADDPQYWERETAKFLDAQQTYNARIEILKPSFNQTGGVHVYQSTYGCEWDDETKKINGFSQGGYDGEDLLRFKLKEAICAAAKPEAEILKRSGDEKKAEMESLKYYLTHECVYWLKKYLDYGRSSLMRTEGALLSRHLHGYRLLPWRSHTVLEER